MGVINYHNLRQDKGRLESNWFKHFLTKKKNLVRLNLEIQLTIKISKKTEQRFGVILAPLSSEECNRKNNNLYIK